MKYLLLFVSIAFCSCSPKIRTSVSEKHEKLSEENKVVVYNDKSELPANFDKIGTTNIGDTGFTTNCDFDTMLEKAKIEARKNGANAILITEHLFPHIMGSTCHRIKADLLRIDENTFLDKTVITIDSARVDSASKVSQNEPVYANSANYKSPQKSGFLLTANVGPSFRVASSPDGLTSEQKDYFKKLKSGLSYDVTAYYVKDGKAGYGVKYNVYKSSGTIYDQKITLGDGSTSIQGDFSDDITISFIGPSFLLTEDQHARVGEANLEIALGYMGYQNKSGVAGFPVKITGGNLGMIGGMGYHFRITPHFLVGPQVSFVGGVLKKLKYEYADGSTWTDNLDKDDYENLWRIDLAIGAKYRF